MCINEKMVQRAGKRIRPRTSSEMSTSMILFPQDSDIPVEVGLRWGVGELDGLLMVRVRRSKHFLLRKKSTSFPIELVGESNGKLVRVTLVLGPLFLLVKMEGDEDRMYVIWVGRIIRGTGMELRRVAGFWARVVCSWRGF